MSKVLPHAREPDSPRGAAVHVNIKPKYGITPWLNFQDPVVHDKFVSSFQTETPWGPVVAVIAVGIAALGINVMRLFYRKRSWDHLVSAVIICIVIGLSSALVAIKRNRGRISAQSVRLGEELWSVAFCACSGATLISRSLLKMETDDYASYHLVNNDNGATEAMMVTALASVFVQSAVPSLRWGTVLLCWSICAASILGALFAAPRHISIGSVICGVAVSCACICTKRYNHLFSYKRLHTSMEQKDRILRKDFEMVRQQAAISDANEWRSIVGNIAHDLKTPVAAMSAGCDFLLSLLSDVTKIATRYNVFAHLQSDLSSLSSTAESMQHTCAFMTMMVHRYVDYTKTSHGLALVPHFEMVRLLDTIVQGPVACVKDLSGVAHEYAGAGFGNIKPDKRHRAKDISHRDRKEKIEVMSVPSDLGTVITDKHWLEENVLCLLSNALKYSQNQVVTVNISVVEEDQLGEGGSVRGPRQTGCCPHVKIEILDRGVGVSAAERLTLFEPLCQTTRPSGGTGLGLFSLAKRTEALGGRYGVADRADGLSGVSFWFSFPYVPLSEGDIGDPNLAARYHDAVHRQQEPLFAGVPETGSASPRDAHDGEEILTTRKALVSDKTAGQERSAAVTILSGQLSAPSPDLHHVAPTTLHPTTRISDTPVSGIGKTMRVLVVDDSLLILRMVTRLLERAGYIVDVAENGREAVEKMMAHQFKIKPHMHAPVFSGASSVKSVSSTSSAVRSVSPSKAAHLVPASQNMSPMDVDDSYHSLSSCPSLAQHAAARTGPSVVEYYYDAVVMDLQMPIMDGLEATRQIRDLEQLHCPTQVSGLVADPVDTRPACRRQLIVGCSANCDSVTMQDAFAAGIDVFLSKPFALSAFQGIIVQHMSNHGHGW